MILCENIVVWKHQGQQEVRAVIPRRRDLDENRSVLIVSATAHKQKVYLNVELKEPPSYNTTHASYLNFQIGSLLFPLTKRVRRYL